MVERKLFKTKLCVLYEKKGSCPRQNCSFAHGNAELRHVLPSFNGKQSYQGGDLRDKLDKRLSPRRRFSPKRDARGRRTFRGSSPSRSLDKNRKRRRRQQFEGQSDYSGSLKISDGAEDRIKRRRSASSDSRGVLKDQLKELQSNIDMLDQHKSKLRILVEEKAEEAVCLTSRIQELEAQLSNEKEESKRLTSKIKKFVKAHKRYIRAQEELKRSQVRLQKLGDELSTGINATGGNEEDSSMIIFSDADTAGHCTISPQNQVQNNSSLSKKHLNIKWHTAEEPTQANLENDGKYPAETIRVEKHCQLNLHSSQSNFNNEVEIVVSSGHQPNGNQHKNKGNTVSASIPSVDKLKGPGSGFVVPSTSMAAHAVDELVETEAETVEIVETAYTGINKGGNIYGVRKLQFPVPPPPPVPRNSYSQYKAEDAIVDVEGMEEEMVNVDIV